MNEKKQLDNQKTINLTQSIDQNILSLKEYFKDDKSIIFREIQNIHNSAIHCCLVYVDGMVKADITNESIIEPILNFKIPIIPNISLIDQLMNQVISANDVKKTSDISEMYKAIFYGDTLLLIDGFTEVLIFNTKGWITRAISEPDFEKVVSGPKEGFTESIIINLSLIRRKLKTDNLKLKMKEIGNKSKTNVCLCYLQEIVNIKIVEELEKRLNEIDIDGILDANYIEELIKDSPLSPFKTIRSTERPDVVAANLLEGRVALFVDGTPIVLTLPYLFIEYFQTPEDYYINFHFATINRILRILAFFLTVSIPAIYISLVAFHHEMIPTQLLLSIVSARNGVPFPSIVEAFLLLFAFEVVREAGARMPNTMGQSISIVGALILGQASVEAKIFSAPIVIVVASTGISGLVNPKLQGPSILIRVILLLLSSIMGLYGFIFGVIGILILLFSMRSFGIPYVLQSSQLINYDLKDTMIRAPWFYMSIRPNIIAMKNMIRQISPKKKGK